MRFPTVLPLLVLVAAGCQYDEGMIIRDMKGTVRLPPEAAQRTIDIGDGTTRDLDDVRLIGPVYLGLYPSVKDGLFKYPHPEMGPVFEAGIPGDTYPYGGTSIGDINFPCLEFLKCKVVSGRFVDFDQLVDWFNNQIEQPITGPDGTTVQSGEYIEDYCLDLLNYADESELRLTASDKNDDGNVDANDLDFVQAGDGWWEAEFTLWQQEYFASEDGATGFTLWGWMDAPSESTYKFSTCDPEEGRYIEEYNVEMYGGRPYRDLLNFPSVYIAQGDYTTAGYVYQSPDDEPVLELNIPVEL